MTTTLPTPTEAAARGLKLLTARHRRNGPGAQLRTLHRIAARAIAKADWYGELVTREHVWIDGGELTAAEVADAHARIADLQSRRPALARKASDALEAALYLNEVHNLGYPVGNLTAVKR